MKDYVGGAEDEEEEEEKPKALALSAFITTSLPKCVVPYDGDVYIWKSWRLERSVHEIKRQKKMLDYHEPKAEVGVKEEVVEEEVVEEDVVEEEEEIEETDDTCSIGVPHEEYICAVCGRNEKSPYQLCEHMAIYHSAGQPRKWACIYCKMVFGRRGGLRRHVQMVHMQLMHKCPVPDCSHPGYKCTKALNTHIRNHESPELKAALAASKKKTRGAKGKMDVTTERFVKQLVKGDVDVSLFEDVEKVELIW